MSARTAVGAVLALLALAPAASAASWHTGLFSYRIVGGYDRCHPTNDAPDCHDGPDAASGLLDEPVGLGRDSAGNLYIADHGSDLVRRVSPTGALTTMRTNGTFGVVDSPADNPYPWDGPNGLAVGPDGAIYVSTSGHGGSGGNQVLRVLNGVISTYAGTGAACDPLTSCGDGGDAKQATLAAPSGLALDSAGNLYIADENSNRVRKVTAATGKISTIAGTGAACALATDACGDGGAATAAQLAGPLDVAVTPSGSAVYVSDTGDNRVRKIAGGQISTVAGSGYTTCGCSPSLPGNAVDDNNGPANGPRVVVNSPDGVDLDSAGNLFIVESSSNPRVRMVDVSGTITTVAGTGIQCFGAPVCGLGQAVNSLYALPVDVISDGQGGLFLSDIDAYAVYWLTPAQPLGIPGPKGDKGDTGATEATGPAGANGSGGARGPQGPKGDRGDQSPLGTWVCRKRRRGIGKSAVVCFARVFADDGSRVTARLVRGGKVLAADSSGVEDGVARLHLRSATMLRGVYGLRLTEQRAAGAARSDAVRVVI